MTKVIDLVENLIKETKGELSINQIAEKLGKDSSYITKKVKILESENRVKTREVQEGKKRFRMVSISTNKKNSSISDEKKPETHLETKRKDEKKKEHPEAIKNFDLSDLNRDKKIDFKQIDLNRLLLKLKSLKVEEYPQFKWIINRVKILNRNHPFNEIVDFINKFYKELI